MNRLLAPACMTGVAAALLFASPLGAQTGDSASGDEPAAVQQPDPGPDVSEAPADDSPAPAAEAAPAPRPDLATVLRASRPVPRGADAPARTPRGLRYDVWAQARARSTTTAAFAVDNDGTTNPQGTRYESRILHGFSYAPSRRVQIQLEVDLLNGQFAGDTTDVGTSIGDDTFRERRNEDFALGYVLPRKAYVTILTDWALLQIGQQSFTWGTGFLANDGAGDPDFGDAKQGSLVERFSVLTMPWVQSAGASEWLRGLALLGAVDVVFRDDNASVLDGDFAFGGVVGARLEHRKLTLGVFESFRRQTDRRDPLYPEENTRTFVRTYATNVYAKSRVWENNAHGITLEGEAAFIAGQTDRPYLDETYENGARIRSFGGLVRVRYDNDDAHLSTRLELGYASGDNDTRDDVARGFSFHSDYNVGLILFDQVMPLLTARAVDRINDPGLIAVTPGGLRYTVNQATVSNALYLYPVVRWRPNDIVDLRLAYLFARSAADFADTFQTALSGGYNTTPGGDTPGSRMLGHEVDVGARFSFNGPRLNAPADAQAPAGVTERLGVEAGVFLPGAAFDGLDLEPVWTVRGHFDLMW